MTNGCGRGYVQEYRHNCRSRHVMKRVRYFNRNYRYINMYLYRLISLQQQQNSQNMVVVVAMQTIVTVAQHQSKVFLASLSPRGKGRRDIVLSGRWNIQEWVRLSIYRHLGLMANKKKGYRFRCTNVFGSTRVLGILKNKILRFLEIVIAISRNDKLVT